MENSIRSYCQHLRAPLRKGEEHGSAIPAQRSGLGIGSVPEDRNSRNPTSTPQLPKYHLNLEHRGLSKNQEP